MFIGLWLGGTLPAQFALPAGLGDIAIGLAAPAVAARLRRGDTAEHDGSTCWASWT